MDPIQVLGQKDLRREIQVKDENTAGQLLVKNTHEGEGRTSGGRHPSTPWGMKTKGKKTRRIKFTSKMIISRRAKK